MRNEERLQKWSPIDGITYDFKSAEVWTDYPRLSVRLIDGRADIFNRLDLCFWFEAVAAFTLQEEFLHPTQGTVWGKAPTISKEQLHIFPVLIVQNSPWFAALKPKLDLLFMGAVHYRLCTNCVVLDIVSTKPPTVAWRKQVTTPPEHTSVSTSEKSTTSYPS